MRKLVGIRAGGIWIGAYDCNIYTSCWWFVCPGRNELFFLQASMSYTHQPLEVSVVFPTITFTFKGARLRLQVCDPATGNDLEMWYRYNVAFEVDNLYVPIGIMET